MQQTVRRLICTYFFWSAHDRCAASPPQGAVRQNKRPVSKFLLRQQVCAARCAVLRHIATAAATYLRSSSSSAPDGSAGIQIIGIWLAGSTWDTPMSRGMSCGREGRGR